MKIEDVTQVYDIDQEVLRSNWSDVHYRFELLDLNTKAYVYEDEGKIVGFVIVKYMYDSSDLIQIAVSRSHQKQKIGAALLMHVIHEMKEKGVESMILEVDMNRRSIIQFYESFNFEFINVRRNYYGRDRHAILMKLEVQKC